MALDGFGRRPLFLPDGNHAPKWPFTLNRDSPQARGLVGWWPLTEGGGPTQRDLSGFGRNTSFKAGTETWEKTSLGSSAVLFDDASSEYLQTDKAVVTARPFTMSCWVNSNDDSILQMAMTISDISSTTNFAWLALAGATAGDPVDCAMKDGSGIVGTVTSTGYTVGKWHHIVGTFGDEIAAYIDGGSKTTTSVKTPTNIDRLSIGRVHRAGTAPAYFSGSIFDARIYNRVLSDQEVFDLFAPPTRWDLYKPPHDAGVAFQVAAGGSTTEQAVAAVAAATATLTNKAFKIISAIAAAVASVTRVTDKIKLLRLQPRALRQLPE